jgi:drug/metabolite transporter (DMT)-like permease
MEGGRRVDRAGAALVILSALCYSSLGILGKVAFGEGLGVPSLLATRFAIAAGLLWGIVLLSPRLRDALGRTRGRRLRLLLWGSVGFAGQSALYFAALRFIPASLTVVLLYTCPAFLALIVWARTRRRPKTAVLVALPPALLGTWLAASPESAGASKAGVLLALAAGLWYAVFLLVLDRVTPGLPSILSTAFILLGAACSFILALPATGGYALPATPLAWAAVLGMVATATLCGFYLFVVGLKRTGSQVASILSTFEPLGTLLLAATLLGERLRPGQWAGVALILAAAVTLVASADSPAETRPSD